MSFAKALRLRAGALVSASVAAHRLKQRLRAELGLHPDDVIFLTEQDCPDQDCASGRQTEVVILRRNLTRERHILHGGLAEAMPAVGKARVAEG